MSKRLDDSAWKEKVMNDPATVAQWVEAIGTLLAVIVALVIALFQDSMRSWVNRPDLKVTIEAASPDCIKIPLVARQGGRVVAEANTYYLRLKVTNQGKSTANRVEVFAEKLWREAVDGTFQEVTSFIPMNLAWSDFNTVFSQPILPKMYRYCDLAHIVDPTHRASFVHEQKEWPNVSENKTILSLDTIVKPNNLNHLLPFGRYRLQIALAGANASPIRNTVEISVKGDWYEDDREMFNQGIGVRIISASN